MKIVIGVLLTIALCIFGVLFYKDLSQYTLTSNVVSTKAGIEGFMNRDLEWEKKLGKQIKPRKIQIKKTLDVHNKKLVAFISNGEFGYGRLDKGLNDKYKVELVGYGSGFIDHRTFKTNKGLYLGVIGRNYGQQIKFVKVNLGKEEYQINLPKEEFFIVTYKVSDKIEDDLVGEIKFFDHKGRDITNLYFSKYLEEEPHSTQMT